MPIGLQIASRPGEDGLALGVGAAIESIKSEWNTFPDIGGLVVEGD
jgi:Asp-tRNA(Asn)/Glu-tRNA(Gln) amidotransferase A subunit family amidase